MQQEVIMGKMPPTIEEVFKELKKEITLLHARWIIYRQLYGHSERRIKLLNECASAFFAIIHEALLGEVQLTLSKLTDPPRSRKDENLSLEQLRERIDAQGQNDLANSLRNLLDDLKDKCEGMRRWRNKWLAHFDLITTKSNLRLLPGISRQKIEEALKVTREYMNIIEMHYNGSEERYEQFTMSGNDGEALISRLKNALSYEELIKNNKEIFLQERGKGKWQDA